MTPLVPAPARSRGREILDDPETAADVRRRAMADVARSNRLFGGTRAVLRELRAIAPTLPRQSRLIDVGTGVGDIPGAARAALGRRGIVAETIGVDLSETLLREARPSLDGAVAGDVLQLPVADGAADVVTCSQVLHHFFDADLGAVIAELHRVTRGWVIVSDLRRSRIAAGGFWLAGTALRFHEVTRRDGVTSVLRGFEADELTRLIRRATGVEAIVSRGLFWRLTARWQAGADPRLVRARR